MKFNRSKFLKKTAMPVPLPSPETLKKIKEEGYGLARDVETKKNPNLEGVDPSLVSGMGLSSGESMRTIPLKENMEYRGRTVHPIKNDKEFLIALDPDIIPGQPEDGFPNNYIKIPMNDPDVVKFLEGKKEGFQPHRKDMEEIVKDWNRFRTDLDTPGKFSGVNVVQIPIMIFKERTKHITPRIAELQSMESSIAAKAAESTSPALLQAEIEWREKINNHELDYQDTVDTIKKLYKGKEAQLLTDIDSGALDPSDEWKDHWLEEFTVEGEDGQAKTTTLLHRYVETMLKEKEDELNKPEVMQEEVNMPGQILEELPTKSPLSSVPTFTGPVSNIASQNIAMLVKVRDEIKDLQELDADLTKAANEINALQSKSDQYLIQHPDQYLSILDTIRNDASRFVRRYSKSIQNASKTTKKPPTGFEGWPEEKRKQVKVDATGYTVPGAINANFLGVNIASAGVSMYLRKIIAIIQKVDERLRLKTDVSVQASASSLSKIAQSSGQDEFDNSAIDKATNSLKVTALKRLNWIEENEESVNEVFLSIASEIGANPDSVESLSLQLKVDMIEKAISQMGYERVEKFLQVISNL